MRWLALTLLIVGAGCDNGSTEPTPDLTPMAGAYDFYYLRTIPRPVPLPGEMEPCGTINGEPTCHGEGPIHRVVEVSGTLTLGSPVSRGDGGADFPLTADLAARAKWDVGANGCAGHLDCLVAGLAPLIQYAPPDHLGAGLDGSAVRLSFRPDLVATGQPTWVETPMIWIEWTASPTSVAVSDSTAYRVLRVRRTTITQP